ncbi:MAG: hypothetical protein IPI04_07805 [Ignavibacteria bacterium]|nr:hypothetical protein [Ignavibacteria bacterium]
MKNVIFILVFLISFSELHSQSKEFTIGYAGFIRLTVTWIRQSNKLELV